MSRYIDADKVNVRLLKAARHETYMGSTGRGKGLRQAVDIVNEQPTADVIEIKHGHWIYEPISYTPDGIVGYTEDRYRCSSCDELAKENGTFCTNCSAKMDEVV